MTHDRADDDLEPGVDPGVDPGMEHVERLIDFEMRLMHQEKFLEQLNGVIVVQQGEIGRLQREIKRLTEQVLSGHTEDVNEPPPHY